MLLSGMYPEQSGIWNNCRAEREESLRDDIATITDLFYQAGYNTSYFGKCHWLKNDPLFNETGEYMGTTEAPGGHYINRYDTYVPPGKSRHSIEYFYQAIKDVHFDPMIYSNIPNTIEGKKDGVMHRPKIFSPKNESQKILEYLRNKNAERDENKPFCMIWSINPPHNPWDDKNTDMETLKKYYDTDKYPVVDRSLVVRDNADLEVAQYARHYFANVTSVDNYIGIVLEELKKMGELDNTIVVFSSDHGETLGSHGKTGKNIMEMEAMAIPFIVHWPKNIKAGAINETLFGVPDVLPTVMGLAGLEKNIPTTVQGVDFSDELLDPTSAVKKKQDALLLMLIHTRGVLTNRYTLSVEETKDGTAINNTFIYDNQEDPYQLNRIALKEKPEVSKQLLSVLAEKLKLANDPWYQQKNTAI
jgi:arylsulfatase A-like enzyme